MLSSFTNYKAPGDDGIPIEVYKRYAGCILLQFLEVFNDALQQKCLPPSLTRAIVIQLFKPGMDPTSYRPIILDWVLVTRLYKIITSVIHPDQVGFMPPNSITINLCRIFINVQTPADDKGTRALLSLDAIKVFDSIR